MQKINKTLIFLFLIGFYTVSTNARPVSSDGILLMEEDAAIGMHAGNLNKNFTLDRDAMNADEKSDTNKTDNSKDSNTALTEVEIQKEAEKEAQRERDRKTPDPKNPNTTALINEWISLAKPPINATDCAKTRYEAWGRAVGRTRTATIQASGKPDNIGGRSSSEYLWSMRDRLDSVDHCTLGEYVTAKLDNQSIAHCKGRYKPKGPKANEVLGEGRQYWNQGKLDQAIDRVSEGQKHVCDDEKVNRALSAMKKQKNNIDKKLKTTSSFIDNKKLDEAERSLNRAAVISNKYVKYIEMKQRLEDARKKLQEEKIADIKKQVQEQAQQNADAREEAREKAQREADVERHAEEQLQREADEKKRISEKAADARRQAAAQAEKNAEARREARIKAAEEKKRARARRLAKKKAAEAKRRAQRKARKEAKARRLAKERADARRRAQRKAKRDADARRRAYQNAQRDAAARRRAYQNAQRDAQARRNAQLKSQRDAAALMNTMIKIQNNMNAGRHRQHTAPTHTYTPTRTHTPKATHTHKATHKDNSNPNEIRLLNVVAPAAR